MRRRDHSLSDSQSLVELIRAAEKGAQPWKGDALYIALKTRRYDSKRKVAARRGV